MLSQAFYTLTCILIYNNQVLTCNSNLVSIVKLLWIPQQTQNLFVQMVLDSFNTTLYAFIWGIQL